MSGPVCVGHVPTVKRGVITTDTADRPGYAARRMACKILLSGYLAAGRGDSEAVAWVKGQWAAGLAELVDLPYWPPQPDQFYSFAELQRRATQLNATAEIR